MDEGGLFQIELEYQPPIQRPIVSVHDVSDIHAFDISNGINPYTKDSKPEVYKIVYLILLNKFQSIFEVLRNNESCLGQCYYIPLFKSQPIHPCPHALTLN